MRGGFGQILRLVGILVEIGFLIPFLTSPRPGPQVAGVSLSVLLFGGVVLGAVLWAAGMFMVMAAPKDRRP